MFRSKKYDNFIDEVSFCQRGFSNWVGHDLGLYPEERKSIEELLKDLKSLIDKHKLQIVNPKKAKITCIVYAQYPDSEGYDVLGCKCLKGHKPIAAITYCGFCGDVNTVPLTEKNSLTIYVK